MIKKFEELYKVKPKATCHKTRQASINARASVRYPTNCKVSSKQPF